MTQSSSILTILTYSSMGTHGIKDPEQEVERSNLQT